MKFKDFVEHVDNINKCLKLINQEFHIRILRNKYRKFAAAAFFPNDVVVICRSKSMTDTYEAIIETLDEVLKDEQKTTLNTALGKN